MYLYFDSKGTLLETINDEALRQYNVGVNTVNVFIEDASRPDSGLLPSNLSTLRYWFKLADGEIIQQEYIATRNENVQIKNIPFDRNRDLKYFKYGKPYEFFVIEVPCGRISEAASKDKNVVNFVSEGDVFKRGGLVLMTIQAGYDAEKWLSLERVAFTVEDAVLLPDEAVNSSEFNWLLQKYAFGMYNYNELQYKPIINQDLSANGFTPIENTYYRHIGTDASSKYITGAIYRYYKGEYIILGTKIVQETGADEEAIMSQKAITDALNGKANLIGGNNFRGSQNIDNGTVSVFGDDAYNNILIDCFDSAHNGDSIFAIEKTGADAGAVRFGDGVAEAPILLNGNVGEDGQVLASQGVGKTPIWVDITKRRYIELTNEDLNTITEAGWYRADTDNTCTNKPFTSENTAFFLMVEKTQNGIVRQTAYKAAPISTYYEWYVRSSEDNGSSWYAWMHQQSLSDNYAQTFSGTKHFPIIDVTSKLQFGGESGSNGQFAMSQGDDKAPIWSDVVKHGYTQLTNEDLNTVTKEGWYRAAADNTCANRPILAFSGAVAAFILVVEQQSDTILRQTLYCINNTTLSFYTIFSRIATGDNYTFWTAWRTMQLIDSDSQTFSGFKTFNNGIDIKSALQVDDSFGAAGQVLMSQGDDKAPIWGNLDYVTLDTEQEITGSKDFNAIGIKQYMSLYNPEGNSSFDASNGGDNTYLHIGSTKNSDGSYSNGIEMGLDGSCELALGPDGDAGTAGQVLTSQGEGQTPIWTTPSSGGMTLNKYTATIGQISGSTSMSQADITLLTKILQNAKGNVVVCGKGSLDSKSGAEWTMTYSDTNTADLLRCHATCYRGYPLNATYFWNFALQNGAIRLDSGKCVKIDNSAAVSIIDPVKSMFVQAVVVYYNDTEITA